MPCTWITGKYLWIFSTVKNHHHAYNIPVMLQSSALWNQKTTSRKRLKAADEFQNKSSKLWQQITKCSDTSWRKSSVKQTLVDSVESVYWEDRQLPEDKGGSLLHFTLDTTQRKLNMFKDTNQRSAPGKIPLFTMPLARPKQGGCRFFNFLNSNVFKLKASCWKEKDWSAQQQTNEQAWWVSA